MFAAKNKIIQNSINALGFIFFMIGSLIIMTSCEQEEGENETKISYFNETESHKTGQNCMDCHKSGGPGEGWFTMAGSVYDSQLNDPYPNATVYLYTAPNGTGDLIYTLEGDALGNFYTTESIEFESGLYASLKGNTATKHMTTVLTTGKCNSCHGDTADRIWTE